MEIENIIFDLDGVIVDVFPEETERAFEEKLGISKDNINRMNLTEGFAKVFEAGKVSMQTFRNSVRHYSRNELSDEQIDEAWNKMIGDLVPGSLDLLEDIAKNKNIYLLSNTNPIHLAKFKENIESKIDFTSFNKIFKGAYYSHKIGWRKPKVEAFSYVINKNRLDKQKTLFIDDKLENIESAQKYGLKTLHLKSSLTEIKDLLR